MIPLRRTAAALAAFLLCHGVAQADPTPDDLTSLPFEQLLTMEVYSASRFVQKASEAPSTVTVITAADIRRFGWRTLADVARSVRGLYVNYDRNYSYLGERGFLRPGDYNTRFLLQIDGLRINDNLYDQATLGGEFPLDLDLIDHIEFVPGPGSSVYGSNAFFGVINVITKKPHDMDGTRASVTAAQAGTRNVSASTAWRTADGSDFLLSATHFHTDGRDLHYPEYQDTARGADYEYGKRLFLKAQHGSLRFMLVHSERTKGIPTGAFDQAFGDTRSHTTDTQTFGDLSWNERLNADNELSARLFLARSESVGDYIYDYATRVDNRDGSMGRWWGTELKLVSTQWRGHKLVAGAEYQRDYQLDQYNYDIDPYFQRLNDRRSAARAGVYAQDEISLGDGVLLDAGLRYDRNSDQPGVASPRAALIWQATADTTFKAIYGRAYRSPNVYERFYLYDGEGGQLSNPDLRRERIGTTELALVQQFGPTRRLTMLAYHYTVQDLVTQMIEPVSGLAQYQNAGGAMAHGLEIEYEQIWANSTLRASYSNARTRTHGEAMPSSMASMPADTQVVNAPRQLAKLNLSTPLWLEGLRIGVEAQYVGPRNTVQGGTAGGFWLANVNLLSMHLLPRTDIALTAYNVLDRHYADPGSFEHRQATLAQDPRTLQFKLTYTF